MSTLDYIQFAVVGGFMEPLILLILLIYLWGTDLRLSCPSQKFQEYYKLFMWPVRIMVIVATVGWIAFTDMSNQSLDFVNLSVKLLQISVVYRFIALIYSLVIIACGMIINSAVMQSYSKSTIFFYEKIRVNAKKVHSVLSIVLLVIIGLEICGVSCKLLHVVWKINIVLFWAAFTIRLLSEQCGVSFDAENSRLYVRRFWKSIDIDLEKAYIIRKPTDENNLWSIKWAQNEFKFSVERQELRKRILAFDKYVNTTEKVEEKTSKNAFSVVMKSGKNVLFLGCAGIGFGLVLIPFICMLYKMSKETLFLYLFFPIAILLIILGVYMLLYYYRCSFCVTAKGICYHGIFCEKSFLWDGISAEVNQYIVVFKKENMKIASIELQWSNSDMLLKVLKEHDYCPVIWNAKHVDKLKNDKLEA